MITKSGVVAAIGGRALAAPAAMPLTTATSTSRPIRLEAGSIRALRGYTPSTLRAPSLPVQAAAQVSLGTHVEIRRNANNARRDRRGLNPVVIREIVSVVSTSAMEVRNTAPRFGAFRVGAPSLPTSTECSGPGACLRSPYPPDRRAGAVGSDLLSRVILVV
jgi:hypothetical protein